MKEITVQELKKMMDEKAGFQLIDVREIHEYETSNLGGIHIPLGEIPGSVSSIRRDVPVIIHCRSGMRSATAIQHLESKEGFTNLSNLKGGILAWAKEVEPGMEVG